MIKSIKEIIDGPLSNYTGSEQTKQMVEEQIKARYGEKELKNLDCYRNMRTFNSWLSLGFRVKRGEKSFKSYTCIEAKDTEGNVIKRYRHPVSLFFIKQVERIGSEKSE